MGITIKNGRIVTENGVIFSEIRIEGEIIEKIGENLEKIGDIVIDAKNNYILPGGIDVHTHFASESGGVIAETFAEGTKASLLGGTTTVIDFAEQDKGDTLKKALKEWREKTEEGIFTDYSFHMSISDWNQNTEKEMEEMISEGISSFKVFLAYDDLILNDSEIYGVLKKAKELGALVSFHCENGRIADELRKDFIMEECILPKYHMLSRPPGIEREAISRVATMADILDTYIYIVHLSSKEGYLEAKRFIDEGTKIYLETCPQYLLLNKDRYEGNEEDWFEGAKYVISPPLRDIESNEVLWNGIIEKYINVVATDHCSFNYKGQKEAGINDFSKIPNGAPGVENRFRLIYTYGVKEKIIDIETFVKINSENPSKIFNLYPKKGVLREGSDGDIIIFNPDHKSIIKAENQVQNVDYNTYEGFSQYGKFEYIILRGNIVVKNEKLVKEDPIGSYQRRDIKD